MKNINTSNHDDQNNLPLITSEEVAQRFEEKIVEIEIKEKEKIAKEKAEKLGMPYINLKGFPISPETLTVIDEETAKRLKTVCFYAGEYDIRVASTNPENPEVQKLFQKIKDAGHAEGTLYFISEHSFEQAFHLYSVLPKPRVVTSGVEISEKDFKKFENEIHSFHELNEKIKTANLSDMVTIVVASAIQSKSSDIHIEAEEKDIKIRFRIDGILHDVASIDKSLWEKIIARIKLLSKLKINITTKPQDGRFTISLTNEKIDVRVSCLPTTYGESVVMRLLMSSAAGLTFEALGLRGQAYEDLIRECKKPNGMIVTTGPTGSGKTTTLYAILTKLNNPETKIVTIEDPVEYRLSGINQSQVERSHDYDFASGLRSILRQDPDIVMVGEIRDLETAEIAINAALTGHLVFSTLHTNDASGTVPRLLAMEVKPFLLAPALNAMIGQRLVRRICEHCKTVHKIDEALRRRIRELLPPQKLIHAYNLKDTHFRELVFYKGKGCDRCQKIGYKGRVGIYEIMTMSAEVEDLILTGRVSEYDMRKISEKRGMINMLQDGILKALEGITSLDEVFRVAKDTSYGGDIEV